VKNGPKITLSTLAAGYLSAAVAATAFWYVANCFSPFIAPHPTFGWFLALLGLTFGFQAHSWGLVALTIALPITAGLPAQLGSFGFTNFITLNNPGLDLAQGFLIGAIVRNWPEINPRTLPSRYTTLTAAILHIYLVVSTVITITNNLFQSTTAFTAKGFLFNMLQLRKLSFIDDYYPLEALYVLTVALGLIFIGWVLWRTRVTETLNRLLSGLAIGGFILAIYAFIQQYYRLGHLRDAAHRGVNSFFPDLHSFASYMLLSATASIFWSGTALNARRWGQFAFCVTTFLMNGFALYLSGSRFTLVAAPFVLGYAGYHALVKPYGKRVRIVVVASATILLTIGILSITNFGYKHTNFYELKKRLQTGKYERINEMLSRRPEVYATAVHMFGERPLTGVGIGSFYRLSGVPDYSRSKFLMRHGGENAHDYPLQLLTELGIPGFLLILCLVVLPGGTNSTKSLILAVVAGNVFAHSLLIHEMMMLMALILAVHHAARDEQLMSRTKFWARWLHRPYRRQGLAGAALALSVLWLFSACKREKLPFRFNDICSAKTTQTEDGWLGSRYFLKATPGKISLLTMRLRAGHPDVEHRPVTVFVQVKEFYGGAAILNETRILANHDDATFVAKPLTPQRLSVLITTDRCFVPKSLGASSDNRRLSLSATFSFD